MIRGRKTVTFCFRKTSFFNCRSRTYYALPFEYCGLQFLPNVVTMSVEFRLRFEPQIHPTWLTINFLFITASAERNVRLCAKLFEIFRGWIILRLTWNMSHFVQNSVEILRWNLRKKLFRENFSKILCKPRLSSTKSCEISPYFLQFYFRSVLRWKNSHRYFHMLFAHR